MKKPKMKRTPESMLEGVVANYCLMAERLPSPQSILALRAAASELNDDPPEVGPECGCLNCLLVRRKAARHAGS